jgi:glyoxylase-like metal-dependent hydrolase (beta-lactamase superfamily II)
MFQEIGDGVFRRRFDSLDLNVGVVIGEDGLLIVDTRASHREAAELCDELAGFSDLPVRWVVNTHWHWDHAFGNALFPSADIWGHELSQLALAQHGDEMRSGAKEWLPASRHHEIDEVEIVAPNKTFSDEVSLAIGREVRLTYHGLGHTDADIIIRVPDAGVAFFGDLIEEGGPPNFGDSHPVAWPLTLRLAAEGMPAVAVPGHGDIVDETFVEAQHEELVAVADLATAYVSGEMALEEASGSGPYSAEVMTSALLRAQAVV